MNWGSFWIGVAALPLLLIAALIVLGIFYFGGRLLGVLAREWRFRKTKDSGIKANFAASLAVMDWWIISPHKSVALIIAPLRKQTGEQRNRISNVKWEIAKENGYGGPKVFKPEFKTGDEPEFQRKKEQQ
ncbi:hypothetical protein [Brevibacterium oceani]|uniref:hypothetical protein n=1 Tax=Brevibacterium oceani TaxID=358099 RepID=UPI0015E7D306|nr:hypothetical protein [Brevibacterium oceani]